MTEGREVAHRTEGGALGAPAPDDRVNQTIMMVREALLNPNLNAESAKVMADLLNTQEDRALAAEFNRALNAAIMEMPVITKDGQIVIPANAEKRTPARVQGKFARYEDIYRVVRPILEKHRLAVRFEVGDAGGAILVRPIISHANGHTDRGDGMRLPLDTSGAKNNTQGAGSAVSYGKRYTLCAILNIVTEGVDDDGNGGQGVVLTYEREQVVETEARTAHEAGRYQEWFATQSPKDRAYLVTKGLHAEYGGKALAAPVAKPVVENPPQTRDPAANKPAPAAKAAPAGKHDVTTAEGWAAQYKDDMDAAKSIEEVDRIRKRGQSALTRLLDSHPKLYETCDAAELDARDRFGSGGLL